MSGGLTGLVLAGGRATRMGGEDKGLIPLHGEPLAFHALRALRPQVDRLLISANRNTARYRALGAAVVSDAEPGYLGPLAGLLAALRHGEPDWLLSVPCDSPALPADYAARMLGAAREADAALAVAGDGERLQPVFLLLHRAVAPSLAAFLGAGGRKIDRWFGAERHVVVDWPGHELMFRNINSRAELDAFAADWRPPPVPAR